MVKSRLSAYLYLAVSIIFTFGSGLAFANVIGAGSDPVVMAYTDMDHGTAPALTVDHSQDEGTDFWSIPIVHRSYDAPMPAKISTVLLGSFHNHSRSCAGDGKHEVGWRKTA